MSLLPHSILMMYVITLLHFAEVVDNAKCLVVTRVCVCVCVCVCLSVCLSAAACPYYYTDPDVTWGSGRGCPPSCALLGGYAIGAWVALLWQHNTNPSYYKLASTPIYDDIVRMRNVSECLVHIVSCWRQSKYALLFQNCCCHTFVICHNCSCGITVKFSQFPQQLPWLPLGLSEFCIKKRKILCA